MKFWMFVIVFLLSLSSWAQTVIKGVVKDSKTKEIMPFAHILLKGSKYGVMSDIDGLFEITIPKGQSEIICSFIGYKTELLKISSQKTFVLIELEIDDNKLETVELIAGENPAYAVIRQVIANKSLNNPENSRSFKYKCYNKVTYDLVYQNSLKGDTARLKANEILEGGHMLMSESITERKFLFPDYSQENIEATRFSGFKNPMFTSLATDIQPFSFYNELIPFLEIQYLNPISHGALSKYDYYIRDIYKNEFDSTYVIEYYPRKNKNIEGLKGFLFINSTSFAIENVTAEPFEKGKINLKIEQKYNLKNNGLWFPQQLNYVLSIDNYPSPESGLEVVGKSYISDVEFGLDYKPKSFSVDQVKINEDALKKDSAFWKAYRSKPLTKKELTTYTVIDSLGKEYKADKYVKIVEGLTRGAFVLKNFELDFNNAFSFNDYEGVRLGLGLYTSDSISKFVRFGGYYGYGFRDKAHKYGTSLDFTLSKEKEAHIKLEYSNDLEEFGNFGRQVLGRQQFSQRDLIAFKMNKVNKLAFSSEYRALKYVKAHWSLNSADYSLLYDDVFENSIIKTRRETWMGLSIRWGYKERFIQTMNQRVSLGSKYPIFNLHYNKGLQNVFNGKSDFNRLELSMNFSRFIKNVGKSSITIASGIVDGTVPDYLKFSGFGGYNKEVKIITPGYFQTMDPYEFVSNKYVNVFYTHNFGTLLFNSPEFKPQLSIAHNMGWSTVLKDDSSDQTSVRKDYSKGYFETGLIVDNVLRVNYFDVGYLGMGAGLFANYGAYSDPEFKDNLVYKISLVFTTK